MLATDPFDYLTELEVYTRDFRGPGEYSADVRFSSRRMRPAGGMVTGSPRYTKAGGCRLSVSAAGDGLRGTFTCSASAEGGGSVEITGEFQSGGSAIDGPMIVVKQH